MTSYFLRGQLPEISGVALIALVAKIACVTCGFAVGILYLKMASRWSVTTRLKVWQGMLALAGTTPAAAPSSPAVFLAPGRNPPPTRRCWGGCVGVHKNYCGTLPTFLASRADSWEGP